MRKVRSAEGEKKAENLYDLSYYRKIVQIESFSLPHPSGAPSSEGASVSEAPTYENQMAITDSANSGRTGSSAPTEAFCKTVRQIGNLICQFQFVGLL